MKHFLLICALLIIPLSSAEIIPQAQEAGYHDTLYTNSVVLANDSRTQLTIAEHTNVLGELTTTQQIRLGLGLTSAPRNSFISHIYQTRQNIAEGHPFLESGNLALQPRTGQQRDIVFLTRQGGSTVPRMTIAANGQVGIGINQPTQQLHVDGNILATGQICDDNGCIGGGSSLWSQAGSDIYYTTGDVGIGTNNPQTTLQVQATQPKIRLTGDTGTAHTGQLDFYAGTTEGAHIALSDSNNYLRIATQTGNSLVFMPGLTESMRISPSGNVGIGTNNPQQGLHVNNSILVEENTLVRGSLGVGTTEPNSEVEVVGNQYFSEYSPEQTGTIVRSPDGSCWLVKVNNTGHLGTIEKDCPGSSLQPPENLQVIEIRKGLSRIGGAVPWNMGVNISWDAPSDTAGIVAYNIYANGNFQGQVDDDVFSFIISVPVSSNVNYRVASVSNTDAEASSSESYALRYKGASIAGTYGLICGIEVAGVAGADCLEPFANTDWFDTIPPHPLANGYDTAWSTTPTQFCIEQGYTTASSVQTSLSGTNEIAVYYDGPYYDEWITEGDNETIGYYPLIDGLRCD